MRAFHTLSAVTHQRRTGQAPILAAHAGIARARIARAKIAPAALALAAFALAGLALAGCNANLYDPTLATRPYPDALEQRDVVQIQAVPMETRLRIINATSVDYDNFDLWLNRRYMRHVARMPAGSQLEFEITDFRDQWGQCPQPGGFWRTRPPTALVLTQIQRDDTQPLIGLVTVLPSDVRPSDRSQR